MTNACPGAASSTAMARSVPGSIRSATSTGSTAPLSDGAAVDVGGIVELVVAGGRVTVIGGSDDAHAAPAILSRPKLTAIAMRRAQRYANVPASRFVVRSVTAIGLRPPRDDHQMLGGRPPIRRPPSSRSFDIQCNRSNPITCRLSIPNRRSEVRSPIVVVLAQITAAAVPETI